MRRFFPLLLLCSSALAQDLAVSRLRCEGLPEPLGIDSMPPRLNWIVESTARGQKQTAYRVLVASSKAALEKDHGDLWDSGQVKSDQTAHVRYAGKALGSRQECWWKVKAWDGEGKECAWSAPARFSIGLMKDADWTAQWISAKDAAPLHKDREQLFLPPARQYRKDFAATQPVKRATAYVSALGICDLYLNGKRVSDEYFAPGWADYLLRAYYRTYDVTAQVQPGNNAVGAVLADGWYSGYVGYGLLVGYGPNRVGRYFYGKTPALLMQVEIEYADGSRQSVNTDATWKVSDAGPWREVDMIMGESFDARLDKPEWCTPSFKADAWANAIRAEDNGGTRAVFTDQMGDREVELGFQKPLDMQAYSAPPIRATHELKPIEVKQIKPGVFIYNLGQNFAGNVRLKVKGAAGTRVQLRYGEMLHPDGRLMTENLRRARATDYYTLRGDPNGETWTPRFTYHGFQYVELTGLKDDPGVEAITGLVMHNDTPLVSSFECSDPMANKLFKNITWTQRANFVEVPTDCPQRDERLGWMGDAQIYVRSATFNADVNAFFSKWTDDVRESQRSFGAYPDYAPYPMAHGEPRKGFGTAWTDAGIICPWTIWKVYGDTRLIDRHYDSMAHFMEFRMATSVRNGGVSIGNPWGDWLNLNENTPIEYIDHIYYASAAKMMGDMAEALGHKIDAARYRALHEEIRKAFEKQYLEAGGKLKVNTQTAYVLALSFEMLPPELRKGAADQLAKMIEKNGFRMATGFLGTKHLLPALSRHGYHDLAVRLFQSRKFPSWGYPVENGATSIWERWDSYTKEEAFGRHNAAMNSFSHYAFGAVCEWMFTTLAGIDTDGPGYRKIIIRPGPPSEGSNPDNKPIDWVRARYAGPTGTIAVDWRRVDGHFELDVTIPANTTATIHMPGKEPADITEGGKPVLEAAGVRVAGATAGRVLLGVGGGSYKFVSK